MISTPKAFSFKSKGHIARWFKQEEDSSLRRRQLKKIARRAQRRDGHKEIRDVVAYYTEEIALVNMFSPIPIWLMSENERLGMEHWRQMKSDVYLLRRRKAQQAEDYKDYYYLSWERFTEEEPTCDETLFEDLKRSTKK